MKAVSSEDSTSYLHRWTNGKTFSWAKVELVMGFVVRMSKLEPFVLVVESCEAPPLRSTSMREGA